VDVVVGYVETHQRVKAITAMKLTRQDMFTTMSSLGLATFGANGTPEPNSPPVRAAAFRAAEQVAREEPGRRRMRLSRQPGLNLQTGFPLPS